MKKLSTYLPVVLSNRSGDGRKRGVVVDAVYVLGHDARGGTRQVAHGTNASASAPAAVGRLDGRVDLWRRLSSRLLGPPQRGWHVDWGLSRFDGGHNTGVQREVCATRRGGRHVGRGVRA